MLEDTDEVACDIVHRPARLDVIGVGGGAETTEIGGNEVIVILQIIQHVLVRGENVDIIRSEGGTVRSVGEEKEGTYLELFNLV